MFAYSTKSIQSLYKINPKMFVYRQINASIDWVTFIQQQNAASGTAIFKREVNWKDNS